MQPLCADNSPRTGVSPYGTRSMVTCSSKMKPRTWKSKRSIKAVIQSMLLLVYSLHVHDEHVNHFYLTYLTSASLLPHFCFTLTSPYCSRVRHMRCSAGSQQLLCVPRHYQVPERVDGSRVGLQQLQNITNPPSSLAALLVGRCSNHLAQSASLSNPRRHFHDQHYHRLTR